MARGAVMPLRHEEIEIAPSRRPYFRVVSFHRIDMAAVIEMIADKQQREAPVMSITCDLMAHI